MNAKYKKKKTTKSFIKDFNNACIVLDANEDFVIDNIVMLINKYKLECREVDENIENELIRTCLENNHDFVMITQLNLVTYAGSI